MRALALLVGLLVLPAGAAAAEQLPAGADIYDGVALNITQGGIDFIEMQVPALVPDQMDLPEQSGTLFSCLFDSNKYKIKNIKVYIQVQDVQIVPLDGQLSVHLDALVSADARVETNGCLFNNGCQAHIPWSSVLADSTIDIDVVVNPDTGRPMFDAFVPAFNVNVSLADPQISQCALGGFFEFLAGLFMGSVEGAVEDAINSQIAGQIEPMIEDALNSLVVSDTLSVMDAQIDYELFPTDMVISPEGITMVMGGVFVAAEPAKCIKGGPGGSLFTPGDRPLYSQVSPTGSAYDMAASISDDLTNQALFAAWEAGLLCMEISEIGDGEPLTTDLLALLGGEVQRLVDEGGDMVIGLAAPAPPVATMEGQGARVNLEDLRIDMMGQVHGRMARLVQLKVVPELTADITIADNTITPTLNFDTNDLHPEIQYNELLPETGDVILQLVPTLMDSFLPNLSGLLDPIPIPDLGGITVDYAEVMADGPQQDYLSLYTGLGGQVDPAAGCGLGGSGGGSGCGISGGCTLQGPQRRWPMSPLLMGLGLVLALARRRQRK